MVWGGYIQNGGSGNTYLRSTNILKLCRNWKGGLYYGNETIGSIVAASDDVVIVVVPLHCRCSHCLL